MSLRSALWWPLLEPQPPPPCLLLVHVFPLGAPILTTPAVVTSPAPLPLPLLRVPAPARSPALTSLFLHLSTEDFERENPQVPKLEKSISGTSPKREHLPLAVGIAFFLMTLLAS